MLRRTTCLILVFELVRVGCSTATSAGELPVARETRNGPGMPVNALLSVSDGDLLAGGQAGLRRYAWGQSDQSETIACPVETVYALKWSPDRCHVAVAGGSPGEYGQLAVLAWPSRAVQAVDLTHDDVVCDVAWHPSGEALFCASLDGTVSRVDPNAGATLDTVDAHTRGVTGAVFLPGDTARDVEDLLVTCGRDNTLRVWSTGPTLEQQRSLNNHTQPVNAVAVRLAENGGLHVVASAGDDNTVRFWQPQIGRMMRFVRLESAAVSLLWSGKSSRLLAGCRDGALRVIDVERAEVVEQIPVMASWVSAITAADNDNRMAAGGIRGVHWISTGD